MSISGNEQRDLCAAYNVDKFNFHPIAGADRGVRCICACFKNILLCKAMYPPKCIRQVVYLIDEYFEYFPFTRVSLLHNINHC